VDWLRSCYQTSMVFRPGGPGVPIKWFWCHPDAKYVGVPTPFYSRNWEDKSEKFDEGGEQPGKRPWLPGLRPHLLDGMRLCRPITYLMFGIHAGMTLRRKVTTGGVPICCLDLDELGQQPGGVSPSGSGAWFGFGGLTLSGQSRWAKGQWPVIGQALCFGGAATWAVIPDVPSLYLKTIIPNPTPGATAAGVFTSQSWTTRVQVTLVGPGGGGGGAAGASTTYGAGGGGASGATRQQQWTGIIGGTSWPYQIGGYGPGGPAGNNPGGAGTAPTVFTGPTTVTAGPGGGGQGGPAVPVGTFTNFAQGGVPPAGGNPGSPGIVSPGGSGDATVGGDGGCSTVGGAAGGATAPGPGADATTGTGSGGAGAVGSFGNYAGGKGGDGFLVVEEWNF
jgi:hypothetical protein